MQGLIYVLFDARPFRPPGRVCPNIAAHRNASRDSLCRSISRRRGWAEVQLPKIRKGPHAAQHTPHTTQISNRSHGKDQEARRVRSRKELHYQESGSQETPAQSLRFPSSLHPQGHLPSSAATRQAREQGKLGTGELLLLQGHRFPAA